MNEIRNLDGKLVCNIDNNTGEVVIVKKDCITQIRMNPDGTIHISNTRKNSAA